MATPASKHSEERLSHNVFVWACQVHKPPPAPPFSCAHSVEDVHSFLSAQEVLVHIPATLMDQAEDTQSFPISLLSNCCCLFSFIIAPPQKKKKKLDHYLVLVFVSFLSDTQANIFFEGHFFAQWLITNVHFPMKP